MSRRDEVLAAALELLDEVGLDNLTVRRLAAKLGIGPGALYRHYPRKQDLLEAMAAHLLAEGPKEQPSTATGWEDVARRIALDTRAAMLSHRDGARLLTTFSTVPELGERTFGELVDGLVVEGASRDAALSAVGTLYGYVNGFAIDEQSDGDDQAISNRRFRAGVELIVIGIRTGLVDT